MIKIILISFLLIFLSTCTAGNTVMTQKQTAEKINPFSWPIDNALVRVSKKSFGIQVSPNNSPVSPERFSGYHTGVDFETFPNEDDLDINVYAICNGPIVFKQYVNGYGGTLVQTCNLNNQNITVLYGHLKLSDISAELERPLKTGEKIAILGKEFSSETDGERKHLHLAIHKGSDLNLLGYVQRAELLNEWIDPMTVLDL
ncbi:hypothetical protein A2272_00460 [Candidatus Peregrinibacteria bacterium RIFOXYA12_FULL_33_12]|nr:MAG: hypothetical protein A2272_00460 [Candidatus Peregrinibacteria bacterium RIFOXYA12_FULL_33_12]